MSRQLRENRPFRRPAGAIFFAKMPPASRRYVLGTYRYVLVRTGIVPGHGRPDLVLADFSAWILGGSTVRDSRWPQHGALRGSTRSLNTWGHGSRSRTQKTHTRCSLGDARPPYGQYSTRFGVSVSTPLRSAQDLMQPVSGTGQFKVRPECCPYTVRGTT